jgi:hypothetical protein
MRKLPCFQKLSDHIRNCLDRAAEAKRRAEQNFDPRAKADLLRLEQSWTYLAQSYQFSERLERFLLDNGVTAVGAWEPISTAPFDCELELSDLGRDGPHALAFPCSRILGGWINAETKERIDIHPSHWRLWA